MQRVSALWQASPRKLVGALFVLMLAAMMAVASGASFTSTSANVGNIVTAGTLSHSNTANPDGTILKVDNLMPGDSATGTVTLGNTGDGPGLLTLNKSATSPTRTRASRSRRSSTWSSTIPPTRPTRSTRASSATWARRTWARWLAGASRTFEFTVTFPDGGKPAQRDLRRQPLQGRQHHGHLRLGAGQPVMTRSLATIGTRARALATMAGRGLMSVLLLLTLAAVAVTFVPGLLGYERYVLVGSSMEPTIHKGSLVFDEVVPVAQLRKGDVITYVPPGRTQPVTHRLISVKHPKQLHGRPLFRTQGDNVAEPDMRAFTLDKPTQARYSFAIPYLGWVFVALGTPQMRLILLVVPALLIALAMLARLWREGGRLAAERAQMATAAEHEAA